MSVLAQGTINFTTRTSSGSAFVYVGGTAQLQGTNIDYVALGYHLIGASGNTAEASKYMAQLIGAPGSGTAESSLLPSTSPPTTFRTGTAAGNVFPTTATFNNIPLDAATGTFEMVVWDNSSGLYPTWAQASAVAGLSIYGGRSAPFTLSQIGGTVNTPPVPFPGLQNFNVFLVPEPATVSLAGLGAAALLIFRRRK